MIEVNVWAEVLSGIEKRINRESFTAWFKPITFIGNDGARIRLGVPNQVFQDWILSSYWDVMDESLEEAGLSGYSVGFEVETDTTKTSDRYINL